MIAPIRIVTAALLLVCTILAHVTSGSADKLQPLQTNQQPKFIGFHHIEFCCSDAKLASMAIASGAGFELAATSDLSTGNEVYNSRVMQSADVKMVFTAPGKLRTKSGNINHLPHPQYSLLKARKFCNKHIFGVSAVGLRVANVKQCYNNLISGGGKSILKPCNIQDVNRSKGSCVMAEVSLYGDVVMRLIDDSNYRGNFLPNYQDIVPFGTKLGKYGIERMDHVVGNVYSLKKTLNYIKRMTVNCLFALLAFKILLVK